MTDVGLLHLLEELHYTLHHLAVIGNVEVDGGGSG